MGPTLDELQKIRKFLENSYFIEIKDSTPGIEDKFAIKISDKSIVF